MKAGTAFHGEGTCSTECLKKLFTPHEQTWLFKVLQYDQIWIDFLRYSRRHVSDPALTIELEVMFLLQSTNVQKLPTNAALRLF